MDIFEKRYFSFNRRLFVILGLWPYGPRNIRKYGITFLIFSMSLIQIISVTVNLNDIDKLMLSLVGASIGILMFFKMVAMIVAKDKMKVLYRSIADNWLAITDEEEKKILVEYAERGRKKAKYYFILVQAGAANLFILPAINTILDLIHPLENPRPNIDLLGTELLLDKETYYFVYYLWGAFAVSFCGCITVSVDTMFIVCVEHCCSLFAIIRYRLRNLKSKNIDNLTGNEVDSYDYVVKIIRLHWIAIEFTKTVNESFSNLFLYILTANIATIPLCAVTVLSTLDQALNCVRWAAMLVVLGIHLFMLFWPGQNVLDHSTDLLDDAYCNEWHKTPLRTKKLLIIFMIRCSQPCVLSAGGLMLMNFEVFSTIVRTALSYITVLASFR